MRIVPITMINNDQSILRGIKPFNGTDKFMRALTRGFRQLIKHMFKEYDLLRSYHLSIRTKRLKLKSFFMNKNLFPIDEFTEEFFEENEEQFYLLIHNT